MGLFSFFLITNKNLLFQDCKTSVHHFNINRFARKIWFATWITGNNFEDNETFKIQGYPECMRRGTLYVEGCFHKEFYSRHLYGWRKNIGALKETLIWQFLAIATAHIINQFRGFVSSPDSSLFEIEFASSWLNIKRLNHRGIINSHKVSIICTQYILDILSAHYSNVGSVLRISGDSKPSTVHTSIRKLTANLVTQYA